MAAVSLPCSQVPRRSLTAIRRLLWRKSPGRGVRPLRDRWREPVRVVSVTGMRILVLGGTVFLSKAVATEAVRRNHEVVCAARGASGSVPDGAELVVVDRDQPGALEVFRG